MPSSPFDPSRRQLLRHVAGAGAALGLPAALGWTSVFEATTVCLRGRVPAAGEGLEGG